jgi:uncharacterized repeat protein (TIGR03803 family)
VGGAYGDGTVFELVNNGGGSYTPTTLASFNLTDGEYPVAGLVADAAGDLFGTTDVGGANGDGTAFEIAKTGGGYASTPTTLVSFNGADGAGPVAGLIADAAGNLFGTTSDGGEAGCGTVFELSGTGIVNDGSVHLWGLVGSEAERKALLAIAEGVPGVSTVVDEMIPAY